MHRPVYQVCDNSSCSMKIKVKGRSRLQQLAAVLRLGSGLLAGGRRKCRTASGGCPDTHKSLRKVLGNYTEVRY